MKITITPNQLGRLALLALACAGTPIGTALTHIALLLTGDLARFVATDGRLLAMLSLPVTRAEGEGSKPLSLLLDREHLTAMAKAMAKTTGSSIELDVTIHPRLQEVRFASTTGAHLVRIHSGSTPMIDMALARFVDVTWIPSVQSFDHVLLGTAARIAGKKSLLPLSVPVPKGSRLLSAWTSAPDEPISTKELREAISSPALWSDPDLLILVMGISRFGGKDNVDLAPFLPAPTTAFAGSAA